MKKLIFFFFFATLLSLPFGWGGAYAQTANEPGSGNALSFDGVNDYIEIPANLTLEFNQITVTLWVNLAQMNENYCFFSAGTTSPTGIVFEYIGGSGEGLRIGHYAGFNDLNLGPILQSNRWYHIAFVYAVNNFASIYVDGILVGSRNDVASAGIIQGPYRLGTRFNSTFFNRGQIDEVRVWNRALTQTEIQESMCKKLPDNYGNGLVGYWRFDEGVDNTCTGGQDACDASGNGNNGVKY